MDGNSNIHLGHLFIDCMKDSPDAICQIDAATGESETNASVFRRSIRLAQSIRLLGLQPGDILALGGRNHLDVHIPHYAGVLNGLPVVGVDPLFENYYDEVKALFKLTKPKIAFCDPEHYQYFVDAAENLGLDMKIIKFGKGENSMTEFLEKYKDESPIESFQPAEFDVDKVYAWLVSSGGTTGVLKVSAIKHTTFLYKLKLLMAGLFSGKPSPNWKQLPHRPALNLSPVQWISGFFNAIAMPLLHQTKIQTSAPHTVENIIDMINTYKPVTTTMSPSLATNLLKHEKPCDLTCFDSIVLTGAKVYHDLILEFKKRLREGAQIIEAYGQTENLGPVFVPNPSGPIGNCGKLVSIALTKLVDPDTGKEITEPNVIGELWTKTACFSEYYNDPESTAKVFSEDGWYKTGDLLYHDEDNNYYVVERLKMVIKYKNHTIIPAELESVIRTHEGVKEVSVTSIPHEQDGEHAIACVVTRPGYSVTEKEICDLVADKLSETKQLRGGVIFLDKLPITSAGKVARAKLRQTAINKKNS